MTGWKFPTSNAATPTRPPPIDTANLPVNFATPTRRGHSPRMLWPPQDLPPPLAPALFPSSPAMNTPEFMIGRNMMEGAAPPHSGVRLGDLLGSGEDVDMDDDSTIGHEGSGYLPVYFEGGVSTPRWG
jgi:hypothetical protein